MTIKGFPTFDEFVNEMEQTEISNAKAKKTSTIKGLPTIDEFVNEMEKEVNNAKANININVNSELPKRETIFVTDRNGVKYELYEFQKEISGLPSDIFFGYRKFI
jgi:uncharacterized FlaG/YvyC family protein